jgi:hypothetical protein
MGIPDPDDYKSHNSSDDDERSSPNASKMDPPVAQTPVSQAPKGKTSALSSKKIEEKKEEKKEEEDEAINFKPKGGVPDLIIQ